MYGFNLFLPPPPALTEERLARPERPCASPISSESTLQTW